MDYFGFSSETMTPKHLCCDNCTKECECGECQERDSDMTDDCMRESSENVTLLAKTMLEFYFQQENDSCLSAVPEAVTGLSSQFADHLAKYSDVLCDLPMLEIKFPYIKHQFLSNISTILAKAVEVGKQPEKGSGKRRGRQKAK